jgi:hypothetical protein
LEGKLADAASRPAQTSGQSSADSQRAAPAPFQIQLVLDEPKEDSEMVTSDAGNGAETLRVQKTPLMDHTAIQSVSVTGNPTTGARDIDCRVQRHRGGIVRCGHARKLEQALGDYFGREVIFCSSHPARDFGGKVPNLR